MDPASVSLLQYALAILAGFVTGIIGGIAGYGSALLLPLVLVPTMGAEAVVPIIAVVAMFQNSTRAWVFRHAIDWKKLWLIVPIAVPGTIVGAYGYTLLTSRGALFLIGMLLVVLVPFRRWMKSQKRQLEPGGLVAWASAYGLISGGTTGSGVILLSMLLWAGCAAPAVIATDATVSVLLGFAKVGAFQAFGALTWPSWVMATLVGVASAPGAVIAKRLAGRLTLDQHIGILDAVVILGGLGFIWQALKPR